MELCGESGVRYSFVVRVVWNQPGSCDVTLWMHVIVKILNFPAAQVEYRYEWLEILRAYVQPLQIRVFEGYNNDVGVSIAYP